MHGETLEKKLNPKKIKFLAEMCACNTEESKGSVGCVFFNVCSSHNLASKLCEEHRVPCVVTVKLGNKSRG